MKLKTLTIGTMFAMALFTSHGSGLYFVSGGDFRECKVKYVIETTEPNQTVDITPGMVCVLNNYPKGNEPFFGEWSLKTMGEEFTFSPFDNIRFSSPAGGCSNAAPVKYTYPTTGRHLVKLYNEKGNVYQLWITNNQNIVEAYIDWTSAPFAQKHSANSTISVQYCHNLKKLVIGHPVGTNLGKFSGLRDLPALDDVKILNPQMYNTIVADSVRECLCTNDMVFVNVTNIGNRAFVHSYKINYASFPKLVQMGVQVFNQSKKNPTELEQNNWGLRKLRIGDSLATWGQNSFWGQTMLDTIEFYTQEENWIQAWNNHSILPVAFGIATAIEGETGIATLTPQDDSDVPSAIFSEHTRRPKPTKLVLVRDLN